MTNLDLDYRWVDNIFKKQIRESWKGNRCMNMILIIIKPLPVRTEQNYGQQTEEHVPGARGRYPCIGNKSYSLTLCKWCIFLSFIFIKTLTARACTWAWSHGGCTAWSGRRGRRVQPGSRGTRADRPLGEAGNLCTLQERDGQMKEGECLVVLGEEKEGGMNRK